MIFDNEKNQLMPEKGDDKPKKLIDYNVVKKGVQLPPPKSPSPKNEGG